ncbi:unnamed protein product [Meganyctiphanes norvegica]|uniref:Carbohydrate sulfotransferase n=1 Tax=Meganyctiphanes norvegica TaxID=48144 RepID=A0AAV2SAZ3_MEGNR
MVICNENHKIQGLMMMYIRVYIWRALPLGLAILVFLAWVIYIDSPTDHTTPVLSLTPVIYITHSLKFIQTEEQSNRSFLDFGENTEDYDIVGDSNLIYSPLENGIEITNTLDIHKENIMYNKTYYPIQDRLKTAKIMNIQHKNITSYLIANISFIKDILPNSLQNDNSTSSQNVTSGNASGFDKLNFASTWTQVLEHRQQRVVEVCRQHKRQLKRIWGYGNLLYDTKHHLAYCRTAKAGTTWWLGSLLRWAGVSTAGLTPDTIHQISNQVFPPLDAKNIKVQMNANMFIFLAVRHPFTRLVSAYRDKIFSGYRKDLYSQMINAYGKNDTKQGSISGVADPSEDNSNVPTFREFALFAAQQVNHCAMVPNSACMLDIDVHWRPSHDRCAPCNVHYDAILKLETFDSDERYIKMITGMPSNKDDGNSSVQNSQSFKTGHSTEDLTTQYFRGLTPDEVNRVVQAYHYDFLLFGYDPHLYY